MKIKRTSQLRGIRRFKKTADDIERAADILSKGGIGAFPTETVYGLGADVFNLSSVAKVFEAKKRPVFDPLIVHISSVKQLDEVASFVPKEAKRLAKKFWPGPFTMVLPKSDKIPDLVTSGLGTVAVRIPAHPVARALIDILGSPIAAPSANRFGRTSPTTADAVLEEFTDEIDFVIDGGKCRVGLESTIVRVVSGGFELLRPGGTPVEDIRKILTRKKTSAKIIEMAPGQLDQHYATRTPLVFSPLSVSAILKEIEKKRRSPAYKSRCFPKLGLLALKAPKKTPNFSRVVALSHGSDYTEAAGKLFAAMRQLDHEDLDFIIASKFANKGLGLAINDRLTRASVATEIKEIFKQNKRKAV